ncbi:MAG: cellulose synthase, partial [Pseudomonadota bacterium]
MKNVFLSIISLILVVIVNLTVWAFLNRPHSTESWQGIMKGVAFSPMRKGHDPEKGIFPSAEQMEADLELLEGKVQAVRIYTVTNGQEVIPELATKHDLYVTAGAWIGPDLERNRREIENLIELGRRHRNVVRTIVGNEA